MKDGILLITGGMRPFGKIMLSDLLTQGCGKIRILSRDKEPLDELRGDGL